MIGIDYAEYKCSACKKEIKSIATQCKKCRKLFFHPGCVSKHRVYNSVQELIKCEGPFEELIVGKEKEEMRRANSGGSDRGRMGSIGASGSTSGPTSNDIKIDWLVKTVKEMKDEVACKKEIKSIIREIVKSELEEIKLELEEMKKNIQERFRETAGDGRKSYASATKKETKESVIIVKPKKQQESETTKKLVKEKINITNMAVGITKLRKGNKGTVILGCESESEMEELKVTVHNKLGKDYDIMEPKSVKPKIKVINIGEEEMALDEENLLNVIVKQNKIEDDREEFHMRIIKKIIKDKSNGREENSSLLIEMDEETHDLFMRRGKINIGWRKCRVFHYHSVKRCFKCWGYYHMAKNCMRQETCPKCAGQHKASECKTKKKRCVNCMHKIKTYNLKINDEHDALSRDCPTYLRAVEEEKKRAGTRNVK